MVGGPGGVRAMLCGGAFHIAKVLHLFLANGIDYKFV